MHIYKEHEFAYNIIYYTEYVPMDCILYKGDGHPLLFTFYELIINLHTKNMFDSATEVCIYTQYVGYRD